MKKIINLVWFVFVVSMLCTINLQAQGNEKTSNGNHIKSAVLTRQAGQVTFCWSPDETPTVAGAKQKKWLIGNLAGSYRLKVWQVMPGRANQAIVTKEVKASVSSTPANNKNPELMRAAGTDPDTIKACTESLGQADSSMERHSIRSKGAGGEEVRAIAVEAFPPCANGTSCDYEWTLEGLGADGKPVSQNTVIESFTLVNRQGSWNVKINR